MVYAIQIVLPIFFFSPIRFLRLLAAWAQIGLMAIIMLTGNYNFFNLVTIVLAVACLDDRRKPTLSFPLASPSSFSIC